MTFRPSIAALAITISCFVSITTAQSPSPTPAVQKEIKRWLDIETLSIATRFRHIETNGGTTATVQQYQVKSRDRESYFRPKAVY